MIWTHGTDKQYLESKDPAGRRNHRNGHSKKTVLTENAKLDIRIAAIGKDTSIEAPSPGISTAPGFDEKIVSMYARGIDHAGNSGPPHGALWARGLPRSDLDGNGRGCGDRGGMAEPSTGGELPARLLRRHAGQDPKTRAWSATRQSTSPSASRRTAPRTFSACGSRTPKSTKFWLRVMNELRNRGVGDILIAVVDGLEGIPEAINADLPETIIRTCVVHLIRHSLEFVSWKDR